VKHFVVVLFFCFCSSCYMRQCDPLRARPGARPQRRDAISSQGKSGLSSSSSRIEINSFITRPIFTERWGSKVPRLLRSMFCGRGCLLSGDSDQHIFKALLIYSGPGLDSSREWSVPSGSVAPGLTLYSTVGGIPNNLRGRYGRIEQLVWNR
jgi:hypothetical protein